MPRYTPEFWARVRARVEDGRVRCGDNAHLALIDYEIARDQLTPRSQQIIRLAMQGWGHQLIADSLGLSRSRITHLIRDFEESINAGL